MSKKRQKKNHYFDYGGVPAEQADFFAIEIWQDGFGADTYIAAIYPTFQQAEFNVGRIRKQYNLDDINSYPGMVYIVGGKFGEKIEQMF